MRKIDLVKNLIDAHGGLFCCPICSEDLTLKEPNSLACSKGHSFDVARKGYLNLLHGGIKGQKYDKALFEARNSVYKGGLFRGVIEKLTEEISLWTAEHSLKEISILDMGCGEGTHLWDVLQGLRNNRRVPLGVGIDIAKEGIQIASRDYPGVLWCVGDLAKAPLGDKQFHVILNIFSPSNYGEFSRLLAEQGLIVKVIPGSGYLQEIREGLYGATDRASYSNDDVVELFAKHYRKTNSTQVSYQYPVTSQDLAALIEMTPLSWQASPDKKGELLRSSLSSVTIDVTILTGEEPLN